MPFIFWASLAFLLGCAFCVHFDVFGFRRKLKRSFLSVFYFVIPKTDSRGRRMKFGMAKTASNIFAVILFLLLISIFLSFGMPYAIGADENKYTGPLGDLFNGILTPILTFLTFCGLLVTIFIQNLQMNSTLEELRLTREEATESKKVLKEQVENSRAQKFDNNFYSLLDNHNKLISDILANLSYKMIPGFLSNDKKVDQYYFDIFLAGYSFDREDWIKHKDVFLPFFLVNFQLLSYIDKANGKTIAPEEAKQYSNVLRSLIPNNFLCLLFVNVTAERYGEYRRLMVKYEFFEHMNLDEVNLSIFLSLVKYINISAFGDRRRFKNYFDENGGSYLVRNHWRQGLLDFFGFDDRSSMYLIYENEFNNLCSEYMEELMSINVYHFAKDQFVFDKFTSGDVLYFLESKDVSCDNLKALQRKISKSNAVSS